MHKYQNFSTFEHCSKIEEKIIMKLYQNASIFLNDAIIHLNKGIDSYSDMLLAIVDIQMSLELAKPAKSCQDLKV